MSRYYFRVFADYFTFEILDEGTLGPKDLWNDKTLRDRVSTSRGTIAISTVRNMHVPVLIEIGDSGNFDDTLSLDSWDHVVECSIIVSSDKLVVFGATDYYPDAPRIKIQPATYLVRIYYGGLSTLTKDGLYGNDVYYIVLHPGPFTEPKIIKQWVGTVSTSQS